MKIFYEPTFRFSWMVFKGGKSLQEAVNIYSSRIPTESFAVDNKNRDGHFCAIRPFKCGMLWYPTRKPKLNTVVHECFHAVMYVFERMDMKGPTEETEEVFAYYLEWLVGKCL